MNQHKTYNNITYQVCLEAVKKGFEAIGGVENAKYFTGFEWHRKVAERKAQKKTKIKKVA